MHFSMSGFSVHHQHSELTQTHVNQVDGANQPLHPLLSPLPHAFILSQHRVFLNESVLHIRWPKYWNFSFIISPSNEYSGLISCRIDWLTSLQSKGLSRVFSNMTVQKHQFFSVHLSSQPNSHINTWPLESHWNNGCSLTPHAASHICVHCILLLGLLFSDIQLSKSCLVRITSEFYPGTLVSVDTLLSLLSQCLYTFSSSMYQASLQWRVSTPLPLSRLWAPAGRASLSVIVSGRYNYPVRGSELNCWVQSLVSSQ